MGPTSTPGFEAANKNFGNLLYPAVNKLFYDAMFINPDENSLRILFNFLLMGTGKAEWLRKQNYSLEKPCCLPYF